MSSMWRSRTNLWGIVIGCFLVGIAFWAIKMNNTAKTEFRVHIRKGIASRFMTLDPANISYHQEYDILQNLISPLVRYDKDNRLVTDFAESFQWEGNRIRFKLRPYHTIDGISVTADDVVFSFKRLLVLGSNTHGQLRDMICGGKNLVHVEDGCDGLGVDGDDLILTVSGNRDFLLPMLSSIDFGVVLRSQVDSKTLKITNFRNTSGPYYLDDEKVLILRANKLHWNFKKSMPQDVRFVNEDLLGLGGEVGPFELFKRDLVDFIPSGSHLVASDYPKFSENCQQCELRRTEDLSLKILVFTERGQRELSSGERIYIGNAIRNRFLGHEAPEKRYGEVQNDQYFFKFGEGGLSPEQIVKMHGVFEQAGTKPEGKLVFGVYGQDEVAESKRVYTDLAADVDFEPTERQYVGKQWHGESDYPHFFIMPTDTSWNESISLLSYSFSMGMMPIKYGDGRSWLAEYMSITDQVQRLEKLRELHFESLTDPSIVPLVSKPYYSIVRKPWAEEPSRLNPVNGLWQITTN